MKNVEAEILVGIKFGRSCKFLVQIFEFFFEGEYCCLVMEYCSGGDLQKILDNKKKLTESVEFLYYYIMLFYFLLIGIN
jgi:serine/threonine protein kinase